MADIETLSYCEACAQGNCECQPGHCGCDTCANYAVEIEDNKFVHYENDEDTVGIIVTYANGKWAPSVAMVNNAFYQTLAEAIEATTSGDVVTLVSDVDLTEPVEIENKDITLNLGEYTISYSGKSIPGGVITVHNGAGLTIEGENGKIIGGENTYSGIVVTKKGDDSSVPAKLTINSGSIFGNYYAIAGNGSRHNTEITINGGSLTGTNKEDSFAIYHPQNGKLTINGGVLTGVSAAIEIRAGELNITNGKFAATSTKYSCNPNGNGTTTIGAAIAISQHTTKKNIVVNISGGEFTGVKAINESNPQENDPAPLVDLSISGGKFDGEISTVDVHNFISGGTFTYEVAEENCAEGFKPTENENGTYGVIESTGEETPDNPETPETPDPEEPEDPENPGEGGDESDEELSDDEYEVVTGITSDYAKKVLDTKKDHIDWHIPGGAAAEALRKRAAELVKK